MDESVPGDPEDAVAWKEAGDDHFHKGDLESARKCYARAIELDPTYEAAWNNLGFAFITSGQNEEARQVSNRLKIVREKKTHVDPNIAPIADLHEFSGAGKKNPSNNKKILYLIPVIAIVVILIVILFLAMGMGQTTCSRCQGVIVTLIPTPYGFNLTWQGGSDHNLVTGWRVVYDFPGDEALILDGTGNKPTIGQTDVYKGELLSGKKVLVIVSFSDGSEQVVDEREF